ncbi:MAG: zinc dependent phospholipase C family protein [Bacteroidota bacterium]
MKKGFQIVVFLFVIITIYGFAQSPDWGFFGHRRINRMAVFTLPPEMLILYKKHIEYLTEHAVDPDKRRYATKHEAVRHYIDIDHWGVYPFEAVPRNWTDVLAKYTDIYVVNRQEDTLRVFGKDLTNVDEGLLLLSGVALGNRTAKTVYDWEYRVYRDFVYRNIIRNYYEEEWSIDCVSLNQLFARHEIELDCQSAFALDRFSAYGILPYHLVQMQSKLSKAFLEGNLKRILQHSADFGHYIADAHVPLHTTENYNGQLTNQVGIHAFWESRIPELFSDRYFDYFVGKAQYIVDPQDYYWDIVLKSHSYLDSVLLIEKDLSQRFPQDKQYCYDDRLERTQRTQCREYAAAYNERLNGMVERRMQASILAVSSAWYTAWVDAGQPDLSRLGDFALSEAERKRLEEEEALFRGGTIKGREH